MEICIREVFLSHRESTKVIDPEICLLRPNGIRCGASTRQPALELRFSARMDSGVKLNLHKRETILLDMVRDVWNEFETRFRALWVSDLVDPMAKAPGYEDLYVQQLFRRFNRLRGYQNGPSYCGPCPCGRY